MLNAPSASQKNRERRAAFLLSASVDAVTVDDDDDSPTPDMAIDDALSGAEQLADDPDEHPDECTEKSLLNSRILCEQRRVGQC
jgi:hypothetical protein